MSGELLVGSNGRFVVGPDGRFLVDSPAADPCCEPPPPTGCQCFVTPDRLRVTVSGYVVRTACCCNRYVPAAPLAAGDCNGLIMNQQNGPNGTWLLEKTFSNADGAAYELRDIDVMSFVRRTNFAGFSSCANQSPILQIVKMDIVAGISRVNGDSPCRVSAGISFTGIPPLPGSVGHTFERFPPFNDCSDFPSLTSEPFTNEIPPNCSWDDDCLNDPPPVGQNNRLCPATWVPFFSGNTFFSVSAA